MKTVMRIMNINILFVILVIGIFYFLTFGMGLNQMLTSLILIISPIWLLTLRFKNQTHKK